MANQHALYKHPQKRKEASELQKNQSIMQVKLNNVRKQSRCMYKKILIYKKHLMEDAFFKKELRENYPEIYKQILKKV